MTRARVFSGSIVLVLLACAALLIWAGYTGLSDPPVVLHNSPCAAAPHSCSPLTPYQIGNQ